MAVLTILLSIITGVFGALFLTLGSLATLGKLPGNNLFGLKVPEVRKDKEIWDKAHKVAGPTWSAAGVTALGATLMLLSGNWWIYFLLILGSLGLIGLGGALGSSVATQLDDAKGRDLDAQGKEEPAQAQATPHSTQDSVECCSTDSQSGDEVTGCAGTTCGSCSLEGLCTSDTPEEALSASVDFESVLAAAEKQDGKSS